jgi:fructose-1,6-bisphosphatase II
MMGSGGSTEGVIAACAVKALGGDMQGRLLLRDAEERRQAADEGYSEGAVLGIDDLCSGRNIFFAATGITHGELLDGVRYDENYAFTHSMVLRSASGTMRMVEAYHEMSKLRVKGLLPEQVVLGVLP